MTPERKAAIVRLLGSRDEHLPEPRHRTEASAGFVHRDPGNVESCPDCLANDRPMFGCETCGGSGWVKAPRARDPYATEAVVPFGYDGSKHDATHHRDQQIEMLGRQTRPASDVDELADANAHPYGWERARKRMYKAFDYGALDQALEQLRVADDGASRALHAVYVYGWQEEPTAGPLQAACERGLAFLDQHLPAELRVPDAEAGVRIVGRVERGAGDRTRALRDEEICRAVLKEHVPTVDVARAWAISVSQVNKIIRAAA